MGSLGASGFQAVAGKFAKSTIGTIAFGALSGGIGAELSDGNFWEGAIIGGVVAGLNHSLHKFSEQQRQKYILENQLEAEGYDPWGKPTVTKEYAQKMMDKVQILKHQNDLAGGRGKISGFVNSDF